MRRTLLALLGFCLFAPALPAAEVDYLRDIKPILRARCFSCHGAIRQKSGLRLDAGSLIHKGTKRGPAVVPGKADQSALIEAVLGKDRPRMPPETEGAALSEKEVALLRVWINQGAKIPDEPIPEDPRNHWAFRTPARPPIPSVGNPQSALRNPIDAFLDAERVKQGLRPNPPADRSTLLRRVYLDLLGLPPTGEELRAFLADDSPDAYEKEVDRLLADPRHGERWGRHWMDVWRYSDPFGLGEEYRYSQRHIWRWRDWIIESLNQDKGYDRMIVEMLAGDEIAPGDRDTLRATGYLARNWYKFNRNVWIQDTVEYTAAGFLGLTLRCARCHDHKYDPLSQQEYYQFRAFFEPHDIRIDALPGQPDITKNGVARAFDSKADAPTYLFQRGDERMPDKSQPLTPQVPLVLGGDLAVKPVQFTSKDFAQGLAVAIEESHRLARADLDAAEAGLKQVKEKVGERTQKPTEAAELVAEKKREAAQAALAAVEARATAELVRFTEPTDAARGKELALLAGKAERQAAVLKAAEVLLLAEQAAEQARAVPETDATKKARTAAEQKLAAAKKAHADAQAAAAKEDATYTPLVKFSPESSTGRRLALAKWITDRSNPLTARVAVNHIWMRHFGKPLVASMANFGLNGQKPTHPELFDWLASEFMESGWSMKHLHRLIVTSEAYRMVSVDAQPQSTMDAENRYYWRMNPRRMEAEVVRDSVLAVAGQLDRLMGGPILDEKLGQTSRRRSVYFRFNTEYKMQFLDQFDAASPTECYERRESVIPQQALALNNSALALNQSRLLAKQLSEKSPEPAVFVTMAFEQVLGRSPTAEERERCERFLRDQAELLKDAEKLTPFPPSPTAVTPPAADPGQRAREDFIQVLFNHNDFVTIR